MDATRSSAVNSQRKAKLFPDTHWSLVLRAKKEQTLGSDRSPGTLAISELLETYKEPLRVYLRHHSPESEVEDRLQNFLIRMTGSRFLENVDPTKGCFRTYLLTCLKNLVRTEIASGATQKRGGGVAPYSLDEVSDTGELVHQPVSGELPPDLAFDQAWARSVLDRAQGTLRSECEAAGRVDLFLETQSVLTGEPDRDKYIEISQRLNMSEGAVKVAIHRIKKRLAQLIRDEIRKTVADSTQLDQELGYLISLFAP